MRAGFALTLVLVCELALSDTVTRVIDTGAGLATVTRFDDGRIMVYDTGHWNHDDELFAAFQDFIGDSDIDLLINSHSDSDHLAATDELFSAYRVHRVIRTGFARDTGTWGAHDQAIEEAASIGLTHDINLEDYRRRVVQASHETRPKGDGWARASSTPPARVYAGVESRHNDDASNHGFGRARLTVRRATAKEEARSKKAMPVWLARLPCVTRGSFCPTECLSSPTALEAGAMVRRPILQGRVDHATTNLCYHARHRRPAALARLLRRGLRLEAGLRE